MRWPSPLLHLAPWLRPAAVGAILASLGRGAASTLGGTPTHLLGAVAAVALGLALGERLGGLAARARPALVWLPLLLVAGADPLLLGLGALSDLAGLGVGQVQGLLLVAGALAVGLAVGDLGPAKGKTLLAALGLLLAAPLPPALSAGLAGLLLLVPVPAPGPDAGGASLSARAGRALGAGVAAAAVVLVWAGLRAALDPTPISLWVSVLGALPAAAIGRRVGRISPGGAVLLAGGALLGAWLLLGIAPTLLDNLAAIASTLAPARAAALLLLPLAGVGLAGGLVTGLAWGTSRWRDGGLALPVGAASGLILLDQGGLTVPGVSAILALGLLVLGAGRAVQLGAVGLGLACFGAVGWAPAPSPERLVGGRWAHLQDPSGLSRDADIRGRQRGAWAGWSQGVAGGVRAPAEVWEARDLHSDTVREIQVELDGLVAEARGRAGAAEGMAGLLAGLLAPELGEVLVLGDDAGRALRALGPGRRVDATVALPEVVRAVASLDPGAERAWLLPGVRLRPSHPSLALRLRRDLDAIVDIARTPWTDAARAAVDAARLGAARRRLKPGGLYVLVQHLGRMPPGAPQALVAAALERFPSVQLWLPPSGADSLILVAGDSRPSLDRLLERAASRPEALAALGFERPLDLAGFAVADHQAALGWVAGAPRLGAGLSLGGANFERPRQHLATLVGHMASPQALWEGVAPARAEALGRSIRAREAFLKVLGEAAAGDLEAVFDQARLLLSEAGSTGSAALDPLLEPHLADARAALTRARAEGLSSPAWDAARAAAVTAQMLNPASPAPLELLGDIALGQGNTRLARQHYEDALQREPERATALTGLARAWRLQGERGPAEEALRRATRAAPRSAAVWQNLGVFLLEAGRAAEAEEHLRRAASLDERSASPHLALAELALSQDDATRALVEVERALRLENSGYAWYLRGRAHFALEQLDLAEEDFRSAVLAEPRLAAARGAIGHIQALRGDLQGAAESFKAVLAIEPDNAAARENLRRVTELQARLAPAEAAP